MALVRGYLAGMPYTSRPTLLVDHHLLDKYKLEAALAVLSEC